MKRRMTMCCAAVAALVISVFILGLAHGAKPVVTPAYKLIDLLGFPNSWIQSEGQFITNRDGNDDVLIYGVSHAPDR